MVSIFAPCFQGNDFKIQGSSSSVHHTSYSLIPAPKRRTVYYNWNSIVCRRRAAALCMDECTSSSVSSVMAEAEETATKTPKFTNIFNIVLKSVFEQKCNTELDI